MKLNRHQKIEITHDILAREVYARIDASQKMRLKITQFMRDRYDYYLDTQTLLDKKDLEYVDPWLERADLSQAQKDFVLESRRDVSARERARRRRNLVIGSVLAAAAVVSIFFGLKAQAALDDLRKTTAQIFDNLQQGVEEDILNLDYDAALEKISNAASLKIDDKKTGHALMEIIYVFNEAERFSQALDLVKDLQPLLGATGLSLSRDTLAGIRAYLEKVEANRYGFLKNRYFPEMIEVPGGVFEEIAIADFQMAKYETTNWQYNLFCLSSGRDSIERTREGWPLQGNIPVVNVSWEDALGFCNWLNEQWGLEPTYSSASADTEWTIAAKGYRLPTEAEWEYAARGGPEQATYAYSGSDNIEEVAWYRFNSNSRPHPVGEKKGNDLDLLDMTGNVWEWCWDEMGSDRVIRGGSWDAYAAVCRVSYRSYDGSPAYRGNSFGFRLVSSLQFNGR